MSRRRGVAWRGVAGGRCQKEGKTEREGNEGEPRRVIEDATKDEDKEGDTFCTLSYYHIHIKKNVSYEHSEI